MCGIAGFYNPGRTMNRQTLEKVVVKMADTLIHRGPNDSGRWIDEQFGIALSHRRLSILDLSPGGHQPMESFCGRFVVVFNGEIYNYREIRKELEGQFAGRLPAWRGHSDTEIMLAAMSLWGVAAALQKFNGMFAFALWDRKEHRLSLVRDRLGEKPLYFGWAGNSFVFGSELKSLRRHPEFHGIVDRNALALYMRHNYIPAPHSIYQGIFKLAPGTMATLQDPCIGAAPNVIQYWSMKQVAEDGEAHPFLESADVAIQHMDRLLRESVKLRMEADVPLGAFLSGGIDSSTVVALMQAQSGRPIKTFSIGFHEADYNEAPHALAVAKYLRTDHTELYVAPAEATAVIPKLPTLYDEPFSDSSQIPTFLVSQLARRHVTVSLSGDGGDELFGGYSRYLWGKRAWAVTGRVPKGVRLAGAALLRNVPADLLTAAFRRFAPVLPRALRQYNAGDKLQKLGEILSADDAESIYLWLVSHWKNPSSVVLNSSEPATILTTPGQVALQDFISKMMFLDSVTYLPDDILVKVDRASMGVSLESRVPFLDHRAVEFAWRLPLSMKVRDGEQKWLLRRILYKYVPENLFDRPKMGFGVPIGDWLRGSLREWAEALLDETRLGREGYFDPREIRLKWEEHLSGRRNWQYYLWNVLMFQAWLENESLAV